MSICNQLLKTTGVPCGKKTVKGTEYCGRHIPKEVAVSSDKDLAEEREISVEKPVVADEKKKVTTVRQSPTKLPSSARKVKIPILDDEVESVLFCGHIIKKTNKPCGRKALDGEIVCRYHTPKDKVESNNTALEKEVEVVKSVKYFSKPLEEEEVAVKRYSKLPNPFSKNTVKTEMIRDREVSSSENGIADSLEKMGIVSPTASQPLKSSDNKLTKVEAGSNKGLESTIKSDKNDEKYDDEIPFPRDSRMGDDDSDESPPSTPRSKERRMSEVFGKVEGNSHYIRCMEKNSICGGFLKDSGELKNVIDFEEVNKVPFTVVKGVKHPELYVEQLQKVVLNSNRNIKIKLYVREGIRVIKNLPADIYTCQDMIQIIVNMYSQAVATELYVFLKENMDKNEFSELFENYETESVKISKILDFPLDSYVQLELEENSYATYLVAE